MTIFKSLVRAGCTIAALSFGITGHAVTFKVATLSPEGSLWVRELRAGANELTARTDGRVKFKFYPGGVMGDDKTVLRKMRVGQLHGGILTAGALAQVYPELGLYSLPMTFRNFTEVDHIRQAMDAKLLKGLEEVGFVAFGLSEVGFAYAMSKAEATSVPEARAQKVWIPDGDPWSEQAIAAFDITPIPLPIADVLGGLKTNLINAVAMPPVGAIALQWHTQLNNVLDLPLLYVFGQLMVTEKQFDKLDPADRQLVRRVMGDAVARIDRQSRLDNEAATAVLRQQIHWLEPSPAEVREWREFAHSATDRLVEKHLVPKDLYDEMTHLLAEYRAEH